LASESKVRAVAIVDSAGPRDPALIGVLHAPVLASFGGLDRHVSLKFVRALRERQRALGIPFDLKVYAEASGGFDDPEDAAHFRARDALDVLHRTRDFFAAQLGK
jgi:dienelactone hydrolase